MNPKFHPNQKPYKYMNSVISLRSGNQFNNHVGVNIEEEDKLTSEPNHLLLNPNVNQSLNPMNSEIVQSSEPSPSDEPPSKPISDVSSEKVFKPKSPYPQRLTSWSNLESSQIESLLKEDVLVDCEENRELHDLYSSFSSDEMLDELNDICSKHETQLEDSFYDLKSIVKNSVGESPPLISKLLISTLDQSFPNNDETHDVIFSDVVHNQEFQVINLLKQHKEASNWYMDDIRCMSFILVHDHISLVDNLVLMGECLRFDNFCYEGSFSSMWYWLVCVYYCVSPMVKSRYGGAFVCECVNLCVCIL